MFARIWSLVVKEFIHLRKDWWLPAFMLVGGAMELLLVGWATSRPITNLPLMVLDQDQSEASRAFVTALSNTDTFAPEEPVTSQATIEQALLKGQINAAVIIPPRFGQAVVEPDGQPQVVALINGAESIPGNEALRAIQGVALSLDEQIVLQRLDLPQETFSGFNFSLRVWFNESLKDALYTTPAELGLMLEFTILLFAALALSRERELGTLEQLLVMPFSSLEIIIGKSIPVILVGFADFLLMLGMVHFAFHVPVRGSLLLLMVLAFLYILVELGKGLVISVISRTQQQAFLLVMVIGMADFMFTGYAAPVESMPQVLQWVANFVPAHHWLNILRGVLLKGADLTVLWPQVLALVGLGLVIGVFSLRYVRRALD
jgi:ABC-2 type transport system permease protein